MFKKVSHQNENDLKVVSGHGNVVYRLQNILRLFSCPELSCLVDVSNQRIAFEFLDGYFGFLDQGNRPSSLIRHPSFYENSYDGIVFMISRVAFAKISQQTNQATGAVFIIDSYGRDENGRSSSADKAVVLKFIKSL